MCNFVFCLHKTKKSPIRLPLALIPFKKNVVQQLVGNTPKTKEFTPFMCLMNQSSSNDFSTKTYLQSEVESYGNDFYDLDYPNYDGLAITVNSRETGAHRMSIGGFGDINKYLSFDITPTQTMTLPGFVQTIYRFQFLVAKDLVDWENTVCTNQLTSEDTHNISFDWFNSKWVDFVYSNSIGSFTSAEGKSPWDLSKYNEGGTLMHNVNDPVNDSPIRFHFDVVTGNGRGRIKRLRETDDNVVDDLGNIVDPKKFRSDFERSYDTTKTHRELMDIDLSQIPQEWEYINSNQSRLRWVEGDVGAETDTITNFKGWSPSIISAVTNHQTTQGTSIWSALNYLGNHEYFRARQNKNIHVVVKNKSGTRHTYYYRKDDPDVVKPLNTSFKKTSGDWRPPYTSDATSSWLFRISVHSATGLTPEVRLYPNLTEPINQVNSQTIPSLLGVGGVPITQNQFKSKLTGGNWLIPGDSAASKQDSYSKNLFPSKLSSNYGHSNSSQAVNLKNYYNEPSFNSFAATTTVNDVPTYVQRNFSNARPVVIALDPSSPTTFTTLATTSDFVVLGQPNSLPLTQPVMHSEFQMRAVGGTFEVKGTLIFCHFAKRNFEATTNTLRFRNIAYQNVVGNGDVVGVPTSHKEALIYKPCPYLVKEFVDYTFRMSAIDFVADGITKDVCWSYNSSIDYTHTYHSYQGNSDATISGAQITTNAENRIVFW